MTKENLITRSGENATSTIDETLSWLKSGNGHGHGYRKSVIRDYELGLGSPITNERAIGQVLKENRFFRTVFFDIMKHNGPFLDLFSAFHNCTFLSDAVYFVKPVLFEEAWDNVSCIYGSMKISVHDAHFFKNILNILGIKSIFNRNPSSGIYFVKIYCGDLAFLNLRLYTIRRYIPKIAKFKGVLPLIKDDVFRFKFLRNFGAYVVITGDRLYYHGFVTKKWSFKITNGKEVIKTPIGSFDVDDWRIYITI